MVDEKIENIIKRYQEIEKLITLPETISDQQKYKALIKEKGKLEPVVSRYKEVENIVNQIMSTRDVINDNSSEQALKNLAQEELVILERRHKEISSKLEELLGNGSETLSQDVIMEIRPGTGGEEASLFAAALFRMYLKYTEKRGWQASIIDLSETDLGGIKQVIFSIEGEGAYRLLQYESGVHRVQRVPKTESYGRIHTSACTVAVLPEVEEVEIDLKREDLRVDTYRAGGPGGQHVNKTSSAVRITHIPTGIAVACERERSQHRNRELAMKWLKAKLYEHFSTQKKSERDNLRRSQVGSGDRSEKIRTYNFPQNRLTDHRIGYTTFTLEKILDGDLDEIIQKLQEFAKEAAPKRIAR
jgi:peptide chain release factor 1